MDREPDITLTITIIDGREHIDLRQHGPLSPEEVVRCLMAIVQTGFLRIDNLKTIQPAMAETATKALQEWMRSGMPHVRPN